MLRGIPELAAKRFAALFVQLHYRGISSYFQSNLSQFPGESDATPWLIVVHALNPTAAVGYAARAIIPTFDALMSYPVSASFYLPKWAGFAILAAWFVLSLGFGYFRFQAAEIM